MEFKKAGFQTIVLLFMREPQTSKKYSNIAMRKVHLSSYEVWRNTLGAGRRECIYNGIS
jgi:hypothetical protein